MQEIQNTKASSQEKKGLLKLDYSIESPEERTQYVKQIIDSLPPQKLTKQYLEIMSNYIIFAMTKQERKSRKINTDNRMVTVNKRQTSFQGLVNKFQNGEDGIYNFITEDKNIIFTPKISITEKDLEEIPPLRTLRSAIEEVEKQEKRAVGKNRYLLKKQLIELRQDQYVIKSAYKKPISLLNGVKSFNSLQFNDKITVLPDGTIKDDSLISLMNFHHVSALLRNYSSLKEDCYEKFYTDGYYLLKDFEKIIDQALQKKYPLYYKLLIYKIDKKQNVEIQRLLKQEFGVNYSVEYISSLWRNKIPKLIALQAELDYLDWYYLQVEKGKYKKCSRCGEIKLAHNKFFSKNNSSKDGFYSICKCCRNKKKRESQIPQIVKRITKKEYEQQRENLIQ